MNQAHHKGGQFDKTALNPQAPKNVATERFIRIKELILMLGTSRSWIYDTLDPESPRHDPTFPSQIKIGKRMVVWRLSEVSAWMGRKIQRGGA